MIKMANLNEGKEIVDKISERYTLSLFRVASDELNFRILNCLPLTVKEIEKEFKLSAMPANRRINQMVDVGLIMKNKRGEEITKTKLTEQFIKIIHELKRDVVSELARII